MTVTHNPDQVGRDLGYGDGWRSGTEWAGENEPCPDWEWPVSNGRGDDFAIGFFDGVTARWCIVHPWDEMVATGNRCLARWSCRKKLPNRG